MKVNLDHAFIYWHEITQANLPEDQKCKIKHGDEENRNFEISFHAFPSIKITIPVLESENLIDFVKRINEVYIANKPRSEIKEKVNIEDILEIAKKKREFNRLDLNEIDFYAKGKKLEIPQDVIDEFKFCGLNNMDFIMYGEFTGEKETEYYSGEIGSIQIKQCTLYTPVIKDSGIEDALKLLEEHFEYFERLDNDKKIDLD